MMAFVIFNRREYRHRCRPKLLPKCMIKDDRIRFNRAACELIDSWRDSVEIGADKEKRIIVLQKSHDVTRARRICRQALGAGVLHAAGFMKWAEIREPLSTVLIEKNGHLEAKY